MTYIAIALARKLAAEGGSPVDIAVGVIEAGYRITKREAEDVWCGHQNHIRAFKKAMAQ